MLSLTKKKTLSILVIAATIFVLGLAATALGEIQSKPFDSTTVPQEVIDAYKSGLPFKQYISETVKNPTSAQLIMQELGNANIECGGQGEDIKTNRLVCKQVVANQTVVQAQAAARSNIAKAGGESQAIKIITEQLKQSPQYLQWLSINRWNGQMPYALGSGAFPFFQLPVRPTSQIQNQTQNQTQLR